MVDDRDRGILSRTDREYLLGESEIDPKSQAERNARARIRGRLRNAILDFHILLWHLEDRDRVAVFEELDFTPTESMFGRSVPTPTTIESALAFFLQQYESDLGIERGIGAALRSVADKQGRQTEYEITIESEEPLSLEELKEGLEAGDLTLDDVKRLHAEGRLGFGAYLEVRHWATPRGERPPRDEE